MAQLAEIEPLQKPKSIDELLAESKSSVKDAEVLKFLDANGDPITFEMVNGRPFGWSVYNITPPINYKNREYLIGRLERVEGHDSRAVFLSYSFGLDAWMQDNEIPTVYFEDPFVTKFRGKWLFGGVRTKPAQNGKDTDYWTEIHSVDGFEELNKDRKPDIIGPMGMKDIRFTELTSGRLGVFSRPQGGTAGNGKVGYFEVSELSEITPDALKSAPIIGGLFDANRDEWGGVNQAIALSDGSIGLIGHIARFRKDKSKEYYGFACRFDPVSFKVWDEKIIAKSSDWQASNLTPKEPWLDDVVYTGGIFFEDGYTYWYGGLKDAYAGMAQIDYPFYPAQPSVI